METISKDRAIKILHSKKISLFSVADACKVFEVKKENTLYKLLQRLVESNVIERTIKGKYLFSLREVDDFELANFFVNPSYVSLESALSFYGILSQFPYTITSVTVLKSKRITYKEKEYEFAHLGKKYFFGFLRKNNFLIAIPEKALLDELYFVSKRLRKISAEELNLNVINKRKFKELSKRYDFIPLQKLLRSLKLS